MSWDYYPKLKESNVPWLGQIPIHWHIDRLKWSTHRLINGVWGGEPTGDNDTVCIRVADFDRIKLRVDTRKLTLRSIEERDRRSRLLRQGDLLIEKSGGGEQQLVGAVVEFDHDFPAVCSNFIAKITVPDDMYSRYWAYVHAHLYSGRVNYPSIKQTTGIQNLDTDAYFNERVAFPPLVEQQEIAAFLDRETARIDALIEKKRRLLELLEEKRLAVITQAVTKGLDPSVPMKDSGIDWLGEVPAHWEVMFTRYVAKLESGHTPSRSKPEYWVECNIPWFSLADVWQLRDGWSEYVTETNEKVSELGLANSAARLLPKGTVMLSRTASVGFSGIMGCDMATTQDFVNWVCGPRIRPGYLLYVFRAMKPEFNRLMYGSTHQTIYMPDVRSFRTPVPSISEQDEIVRYIRSVMKSLRKIHDDVQKQITNLQEYRSALITNAVTGKIDVRGSKETKDVMDVGRVSVA